MMAISLLKRLYGMISGSGFLWRLVRNYRVLSDSISAIEATLSNMSAQDRKLPNESEIEMLLKAVSNILKTGVIDIPGVDEMNLALNIDQFSQSFSMSIQDAKSGKYFELPRVRRIKVSEVKEVEVKDESESA